LRWQAGHVEEIVALLGGEEEAAGAERIAQQEVAAVVSIDIPDHRERSGQRVPANNRTGLGEEDCLGGRRDEDRPSSPPRSWLAEQQEGLAEWLGRGKGEVDEVVRGFGRVVSQ
jgi:hypothetical protein